MATHCPFLNRKPEASISGAGGVVALCVSAYTIRKVILVRFPLK